jgi:hypothetical protein
LNGVGVSTPAKFDLFGGIQMTNSPANRNLGRLVILAVGLFALAAFSSARSHSASSINIVNNSNREIIHVYLSHVDLDDWGGNQLGETTIAPGRSFTVSNVTCDQPQTKVIGEDRDGCFSSAAVACGDNATWTISNDTEKDCGN